MAKNLMIMGTMSSAGKSFIVTGLCRLFSRMGYKVAPFKSQNMALNSYVTDEGLEMGRAQVVQAEACGKNPSVHMNPILLKPSSDVGSQVIVHGKSIGNMKADEYYKFKPKLIPEILSSYEKLSEENDLIIIEGAGSPAEINLKENDIVNMGLAKLVDAPVLLVGDIDLGGVFAQLIGTLILLEDEEKERIKGLLINKFRGDVNLLKPGITQLEEKANKKVIGVVPMVKANIEQEDSVTSAFVNKKTEGKVDIAIIRLPYISNFTDFEVLKLNENANVRFVDKVSEFGNPDLIILPGTKSTIADLRWLKQEKLADEIICSKAPIVGICGGYQMLGEEIEDPDQIETGGQEKGLGLLAHKTILDSEKTTKQVSGTFENLTGIFEVLNGIDYEGYEIHNGKTEITGKTTRENILGTYVHGIFDKGNIASILVNHLSNIEVDASNLDYQKYKMDQYDLIADAIEESINIEELKKIIGLE